MSLGDKLRNFFSDKAGNAGKRARKKILAGADWDAVKDDIFPAKGTGAPMATVIEAVIEAKNYKLLTPLVAEAGDWIGVIDLIYRKGEYGAIPAGREKELEDMYNAIKAAPRNAAKVLDGFMNTVEIWSAQHNFEAGYDWAKSKPEFRPLPPLGLAALAEHPIEGNSFAMKVLATPEDIKRAVEAIDWVEHNNFDRDQSLDNLEKWRKKLEENSKKPPAAAPKGPAPN